ncbi:MAG: phenylacetate-CoA oxygenase/reductase subunit PaaK [Bacteroidetes bacterium]|nr:phenylacetate-CoA oxygenase/reductase subunit PaaK [Bacteroidota bacterium]
MAVHFHKLKIRQVKKETADCVSISFDIPETLKDVFEYKEGQNITIRTNIDGEEIRRSYSVCNAPFEKELRVAVKKIDGGVFSRFANDILKPGDELDVLPPTGKFNARLNGNKTGNYLAIAAGSGITPVISIIKHTLKTDPGSSFTLLYGNRDRHSIIFFDELEGLKNTYMDRFNFINILSREKTDTEIFYGRIDENKLAALGKLISYENFDDIYLCGPEQLIFTAADYLQRIGINKDNIHFELFTTPGQKQAATQTREEQKDTGPKSQVTVKLDGRSIDFELGFQSSSILDAALKNGADLPFACKGGVCATCRAKLVEGKVDMDVNYALEKEELEQGFILTCQSHPKTEKVVVDFDIK